MSCLHILGKKKNICIATGTYYKLIFQIVMESLFFYSNKRESII